MLTNLLKQRHHPSQQSFDRSRLNGVDTVPSHSQKSITLNILNERVAELLGDFDAHVVNGKIAKLNLILMDVCHREKAPVSEKS